MDGRDNHASILHNVRTGVRYHLRRQAFFDRWHRLTGVVSLVFSSAAVVTMLKSPAAAAVVAAIVAVVQAFDLMFETRKHGDLHRDLRNRYLALEPELADTTELTEAECLAFRQRIASIEIDEPPPRRTLLELCQNEAAIVSGYTREDQPDSFTDLNWFQLHFPNIF